MHLPLSIPPPRLLAFALALLLLAPLIRAEDAPPFDPAQLRVARADPASDDVPASAVIMRLDSKRHFRLTEGSRFSPDGVAEYTVAAIRDDGHVDLLDEAGNRLTIYAITEEEKAGYLSRLHAPPETNPAATHDHD